MSLYFNECYILCFIFSNTYFNDVQIHCRHTMCLLTFAHYLQVILSGYILLQHIRKNNNCIVITWSLWFVWKLHFVSQLFFSVLHFYWSSNSHHIIFSSRGDIHCYFQAFVKGLGLSVDKKNVIALITTIPLLSSNMQMGIWCVCFLFYFTKRL